MITTVYTIGHGNHSLARFLALLGDGGIETVVDVRSVPWSRRWPWFRRRELAAALLADGRRYRWLGESLGGRPGPRGADRDAGLAALLETARSSRTAIMCAEADPAHCHRGSRLAPALLTRGAQVVHLLAGGGARNHTPGMDDGAPETGDLFAQ